MGHTITVLYFAWLREQVGTKGESLVVPAEVNTAGRLIEHLVQRGPGFAKAFSKRASIRCAVNQEFAQLDHPVGAGDEVAFFPPVTGG